MIFSTWLWLRPQKEQRGSPFVGRLRKERTPQKSVFI